MSVWKENGGVDESPWEKGDAMILASCRDVAQSLAQGDFDSGPWSKRLALQIHYIFCYICRRYAAQLRFLGFAARQSAKSSGDDERVAALKRKVMDRLDLS